MGKNRYPGLRSFEEDDETLFFGRDKESAQLASIIYSERFVVLFGNSGVGKSSLLNTLYRKQSDLLKSFQPIRIRIQANQKTEDGKSINPLEIVKNELTAFFKKKEIAFNAEQIVFDKGNVRLWEWIKLAETAAKHLDINFVLVFDQFEEYFSLPVDIQDDFSCQLSEILHEQAPARVLDWMAKIKDEDRTQELFDWYSQVNAKIVFSIRSDKLYYMGGLVNFIPGILRSRMELKPFDPKNAEEAITKPGGLEGSFVSPKIVYTPVITEKITQAVMNDSKEVDSSLLQVICYSLEQTIIARNADPNGSYELKEADFSTLINLDQILDNFYENQTNKFGDKATIELVRLTIEDNFVEKGERVALSRQQLISRLNGKEALIADLLSHRLIREEIVAGKTPKYELIHDKLIATVQRRKDLRDKEKGIKLELEQEIRERGKRARYISTLIAFVIVIVLAIYFYRTAGNAINNTLVERARDSYNNNNEFLAYKYMYTLQHNKYKFKLKNHEQSIKNFNIKPLFDISGGNKIEVIDESTFAVYHNADQTIYIWKSSKDAFAGKEKLVLVDVLSDALNMLVAEEGQYIAYRATNGLVYVYDIRKRKLNYIRQSKVELSSIGNNRDTGNISDYKMIFIENSSWLVFIDEKLNFSLYNAEKNTTPSVKFRSIADGYNIENIKKIFHYSRGTNYMATENRDIKRIRFWDMTKVPLNTIGSALDVSMAFATSQKAQFAYLTTDNKFYCRTIDSDRPAIKLADNVTMIIPFRDGSKVIILMKNRLRVYDFNNAAYDVRYDQNNRLFIRLQRNRNQIGSSSFKWSKDGQFLMDGLVIVDFVKAESFPKLAEGDTASIVDDSENYDCITNRSKDQTRIAYINQDGYLIVKNTRDSEAKNSWRIATQSRGTLKHYYYLSQLCKFSDSGRYFAFISPEKKEKRLTIVDLYTDRTTVLDYPVKIIGSYFTDEYIHVISNSSKAGGLIFLNGKKRDIDYYNNLFPTPIKETEKTIIFK